MNALVLFIGIYDLGDATVKMDTHFLMALILIAATTSSAVSAQSLTVWQRIQAEPSLSSFATLVEATGVDEMLATQGLYTVFAPSDTAFASMPVDQRDELLGNPDSAVARTFVMQHIALQRLEAQSQMGQVSNVTMMSGETQRFAARFDGCGTIAASLGETELMFTDIRATNGVLHTLDTAL